MSPGSLKAFAWAGLAALVCGLAADPVAAWSHLLLAGWFGVQVGLGAAVFIAVQGVTSAGWPTAFRRVPEALTALVPVGGVLVLVALLACPGMYPWTDPSHEVHGAFKHVWLSRPFFLLRAVAYVALWTVLSKSLVSAFRRPEPGRRGRSALFLVLFGASYSLASFDWIMSREPEWASTMFGVYQFAGLFTAALAAIVLACVLLWRAGPLRGIFSQDHQHDLGKLLFGMTSFWMYIWYSEFMLIWYVHIPEETGHYAVRQHGALHALFWVNVVLNWAVPFLFLMPREAKSRRKILLNVSIAVLAGHALDLWLGFLPPTGGVPGILCGLAVAAGAAALFAGAFRGALASAPLVPGDDPYLVESLPQQPHASEV